MKLGPICFVFSMSSKKGVSASSIFVCVLDKTVEVLFVVCMFLEKLSQIFQDPNNGLDSTGEWKPYIRRSQPNIIMAFPDQLTTCLSSLSSAAGQLSSSLTSKSIHPSTLSSEFSYFQLLASFSSNHAVDTLRSASFLDQATSTTRSNTPQPHTQRHAGASCSQEGSTE